MKNDQQYTGLEIAIIGISCRFPDAGNWRAYWENLINGTESVRFLSEQELSRLGVDKKTIDDTNFVNARIVLKDKDLFDSSFFDYIPGEARLMNPVHRIFHECVWEALEDAGYDPKQTKGLIGLYAGAGEDLNWKVYSMIKNKNQDIDDFTLHHINNKDYVASLVSYKLNLQGPSFSIYTGCSTSLVAINLACKSLLLGETKMSLAGGVSVLTQKQKGYFYLEGMIFSSDGHCKAFDKDASGTIPGEGAGIVVLKRLADAINDRDHIYAIIKGSAINNDGNRKVGFTAPSVEGQAECIRKAQKFAKVGPETISYIETHGTGTKLGDPIEVEALNTAFNRNKKHNCAIGSVKTNIGHLDTAAGVAGLIKTALSLKFKKIPASLHYKEPNPEIDFDKGPFYVNAALKEWERSKDFPLRAGVSSFGIGGTNAHAILEEAPPAYEDVNSGRTYKLLTVSAKTGNSLVRYTDDLKRFLLKEPAFNLADMSYTLQVGRKHFSCRKAFAYNDKEQLIQLLDSEKLNQQILRSKDRSNSVVFMFSGGGSQYVNMGRGLYEGEALFREEMDKGFAILEKLTGERYKDILYPKSDNDLRVNNMLHTQPVVFLFGYSLAQLMMSWGIKPAYMIGHSLGEYIAACISGVFSYEEALKLVVKRGQLMNNLSPGSMLSVSIDEASALKYTNDKISLAATNGPNQVVFSGDILSIDDLRKTLEGLDISCAKLHLSHASHSPMIDEILGDFKKELSLVTLNPPKISFMSNLTGNAINDKEVVTVDYWSQHFRKTVRFSHGIKALLSQNNDFVFIEIGGGHSLTTLVRQQQTEKLKLVSINLVRHPKESEDDLKYLTERLGQLWAQGVTIDWSNYYKDEKRKRISLPTYSFEPIRYPTEVDPFENGLIWGNNSINLTDSQYLNDFDHEQINNRVSPDLLSNYEDAHTDSERKLKIIFENFFGIQNIGIEDNFFELGGDSLKGMMLLERIKKEFNINLTLKDFFENQTIKQFAFKIDEIKFLLHSRNGTTKKVIKI